MNKIYIVIGAVWMFLFASCNSWLDVKPDDKLTEDEILSTPGGFQKAMNGVYTYLASHSLYGWELGPGTLDVLAQLYEIDPSTGENHSYKHVSQYDYQNPITKPVFNVIWKDAYFLIANVNNLLLKITPLKDQMGKNWYDKSRGELFALRAFLHFDMLRLFGPMDFETNKDQLSIPYYLERTPNRQPLLSMAKVIELIEQDLEYAEALLLNDPIFTGGISPLDRSTQMNFFAVKALQARIALYKGDRNEAMLLSRALIASQGGMATSIKKMFPFVNPKLVWDKTEMDHVFMTELLFSIYLSDRDKYYESHHEYKTTNVMFLAPKHETIIVDLLPNPLDFRRNSWNENPGGGRLIEFTKYQKNGARIQTPYFSLIRKSELMLILAETTDNETEAFGVLNTLYMNRGYETGAVHRMINEAGGIEKFLHDEYKREFYGEGQYFFYMKRKGISQVKNQSTDVLMEMGEAQYVVPLPDSEEMYN